ncbi:MAG: hypothetical protein QXD77_00565 [Candidatus Aenigmatarchaeota archaeon]
MEKYYLRLCGSWGDYFKTAVPPSPELCLAVKSLGWKMAPEKIVNTARTAMVVSGAFFAMLAVLAFALNFNVLIFIIAGVLFPFLFNQIITDYPKTAAKQRALTSLGAAPHIIAQLSVSLKQNPNLESALAFVAKYGEGEIAKDMRRLLWRVWAGKIPSTLGALPKLADKWGKWSEGFQRSMYLIISSFHERNPKSKAGSLDRAVEAVLNDILMKMREYTLALHIPTLILFSFGIIMPLMVIALFPLLGFFGVPLGLESITLFLFASLLGVYIYSNGILSKRPVTFILPEIETDVPRGYIKIGNSVLPALPFCAALAVILSGPSIFYLLSLSKAVQLHGMFASAVNFVNTIPIIWGLGGAMILYFWGSNWFKTDERKRIKQIDAQLPDALYYIRNVLSEGRPLEEALEFAGQMMGKTPLAVQMKDASNLIKRRHITTEAALVGRESPFERKSKLLQSTLFMLTASLRGGIRSAAQTCHIMHNYMRRINKIEKNLQNMLSRNLSMMRLTAMMFAPLVGAVITVLFALIVKGMSGATSQTSILGFSTMSAITTPNIPTPVLQLILGLYVLGLNFVLIRYVTTIENGSDSVKLGMDLSTSLTASLLIFTVTLIGLWSLLIGG